MTIRDRDITGNYGEDSIRIFECDCCGEEENGHPYYGELDEPEGAHPLCETCYDQDAADHTAMVYDCYDGDRFQYRLGSYRIETFHDEWEEPIEEFCRSIHWVSTDPWRGYYTFKTPEGWVSALEEGCGIDGAFMSDALDLFRQKWSEDKDNPPCRAIVAFPRTSNVCWVNVDVWVEEGNEEAFKTWLES